MEQFLVEYGWTIWVGLILLFVIVEMLTLDFTALMLALGSSAGLISGFAGAPFWLQIVIAAAFAVALLFVRPPLRRLLERGADPARSNVEALIGLGGVATTRVTRQQGQVKLANGEVWTARTAGGPAVPEGAEVTVLAVEGATAVIATTTEEG